jgi:hypothetical protein
MASKKTVIRKPKKSEVEFQRKQARGEAHGFGRGMSVGEGAAWRAKMRRAGLIKSLPDAIATENRNMTDKEKAEHKKKADAWWRAFGGVISRSFPKNKKGK